MIAPVLGAALSILAFGAAQPVGMPVFMQAAPGAAYAVKCHVRTFQTKGGGIANTYTLIHTGPFHDVIPSPLAQCQLWKTGGPGPVTLHITKTGDHAVTAAAVGKPVPLQVY